MYCTCAEKNEHIVHKKALLTPRAARDSAPWWIGIQYRHLAENCVFFIPLSYSAAPLPIFPLEFHGEVKRQETSHGATLWWRLRNPNFNRLWLIHPCEGQTDRRTDGGTDGRWHIARYSICCRALKIVTRTMSVSTLDSKAPTGADVYHSFHRTWIFTASA